ncbi:MAG: hypothetical protein DHS20C11_20420 [Lysobacteraceae bacterium]|nr:MAG: hypothetical protein DHS20C11_20420 [Xanthomonadaceae bacterium]
MRRFAVGRNPVGVAVEATGSRVYVTNKADDTVSVIFAAETIVKTVAVGNEPTGIATNADGRRVYVANSGSNTVSVVEVGLTADSVSVVTTIGVGERPFGLAISPDGGRVYVSNSQSDTVSVIETDANTVIATVDVGGTPRGVAVSPDGSLVYVANSGSPFISVVDANTNHVIASPLNDVNGSYGIAVSHDGNDIYTSNPVANTVTAYSGGFHDRFTIVVGSTPRGVAFSGDDANVYVANEQSGDVSVVDVESKSVIAVVEVEGQPVSMGDFVGPPSPLSPFDKAYVAMGIGLAVIDIRTYKIMDLIGLNMGLAPGVAVTPTGMSVYITNRDTGELSIVDTSNNSLVATVPLPGARGIAISPQGDRIYIASGSEGTLVTLDAATQTIINSVSVGNSPFGVAVNADGSEVYVTNLYEHSVTVINSHSGKVIDSISVGGYPFLLALSADGNKAYVANWDDNTVSIIDTSTRTEIGTISEGFMGPYGIVVSPDGSRVYVTNNADAEGTVSVIDTTSNTVISQIPVGLFPTGLSLSDDGARLFVAIEDTRALAVINTREMCVTDNIELGDEPRLHGEFLGPQNVLFIGNFENNGVDVCSELRANSVVVK